MQPHVLALLVAAFASLGDNATADMREALPAGALARLGTICQRLPARAKLAIRPDGRTFVTVVAGRLVGEWDAASGTLLRRRRLPGPPTEKCWLASNGELLAVMEEHNLVVWDVREGKQRHVLDTFPDVVALSADGKWLAETGGNQKQWIDLWNLADGTERRLLGDKAHALVFAPDGKRLFAVADDSLLAWNTSDVEPLWKKKDSSSELIVAPDGRTVCTVTSERRGTLHCWEAATGRLLQQIDLNKNAPRCTDEWTHLLAFTRDGRRVLLDGPEGVLSCELSSGKVTRRFPRVDQFRLAPDGKTALTVRGSLLQRWDMETDRPLYPDTRSLGHANPVVALAFAPDGRTLASSSSRDTIHLWDMKTRRPRTFPVATSKGWSRYFTFRADGMLGVYPPPILAFTPDSQRLLVESANRHLSLRRVDTGEEALRLNVCPEPTDRIRTARIAPDGKTIWTWCDSISQFSSKLNHEDRDTLAAWSAETGRRLSAHTITRIGGEPHLISPDGRTAAMEKGEILNVATGQPRIVSESKAKSLRSFAFSADSRLLAAAEPHAASRWNEVRVYEMLTGRLLARLTASVNDSSCCAFSPDGRLLMAAGTDALHVWDVATGRRLLHLPAEGRLPYWAPPHFATCLAIAPDGRSAATGHDDGTILLWDLAPAWRQLAAPGEKLTAKRRLACWTDLLAEEPKPAYVAMNQLTADPAATVAFLGERLRPPPLDAAAVKRWLSDLDGDDFARRENASRELKTVAERIEPRLRQAFEETESLETRRRLREILEATAKSSLPPETVRQLRAVAVLEQIATPEARSLLQELARGDAVTRLTTAAADALRRLSARKE